jgi:hypothetical protein
MFSLVYPCLKIEMSEVALPYPIINEIHARKSPSWELYIHTADHKMHCLLWNMKSHWKIGSFVSMAWHKIMSWMRQITCFRYGVLLLSKQSGTDKKCGSSTSRLVKFLVTRCRKNIGHYEINRAVLMKFYIQIHVSDLILLGLPRRWRQKAPSQNCYVFTNRHNVVTSSAGISTHYAAKPQISCKFETFFNAVFI